MAAPFCVSWETMDNDGGEMKRRELREHIFQLLFRVEFNEKDEMAKQVGLFVEDMEEETEVKERDKTYISEKYAKIVEKLPEIDKMLDEVSKGWKTSRMGKVDLTLIRLAVYEIKFEEDVPTGVAINEAVELAKRYGTDDSASFVNGILAKLA